MNHGLGGALLAPSAYFMKSPAEQYHDGIARDRVDEFISVYGRKTGSTVASDLLLAESGD